MITVHHLNNSRSTRVLWLLEELGLPYEIKFYQRDPQTMQAPDALKAIHPLGKAPILTDDGQVVAESGAIIEYLIGRYDSDRLAPSETSPERLAYTFWLHYAEGSAMPPLLLKLVFSQVVKKAPFLLRPLAAAIAAGANKAFIDKQLALHGAYWNETLAKQPWFAGEHFSAADIQMSFPVLVFLTRSGMAERFPLLSDFAAKIADRPAYAAAIKKGGPIAL